MIHAAAAALLLAALSVSVSARIFTSIEGKTVDAELVSMIDDQVTFRRTDNSMLHSVPLSAFSIKDRNYIRAEQEAGRLNSEAYSAKQPFGQVEPVRKVSSHAYASQQIDELLSQYRAEHNQPAAPIVDDATYLRRAYLKIIGRIPTHAEAVHFLNNPLPDKRASLIDELLDSQGYVSHNFNLWADILRARTTGRDGTRYGGVHYVPWLKEQIRRNVPYDTFVKSLVTAEGYPWDNPAVGYYLRDFGMPLDNMSITAQIFLGTQMQCAQCHDHPTDVWTQKDFYQLSAFTYGLKTGVSPADQKNPKLTEVLRNLRRSANANAPKNPQDPKAKNIQPHRAANEFFQPLRWGVVHSSRQLELPHDYQYEDASPKDTVQPAVPFGNLSDQNLHDSVSRVDSYANWMVSKNNQRFTLVIANRMWKHVMGKGLIEPVDHLTDQSEADIPELMSYLESLMQALDYDLKQYLRILYNTEQFQRATVIDNPDLADDYFWEGPIFQRMSAEQFWDSIAALMDPDVDLKLQPTYKGTLGGISYESGKKPAPVHIAEQMNAEQLTAHILGISELYHDLLSTRSAVRQAQQDPQLKGTAELAQIRTAHNKFSKEWKQVLNPDLQQLGLDTSMEMGSMMSDAGIADQRQKKQQRPGQQGLQRASELQSPQRNGHLLEVFGQSDRMLVENSDDGGNVLQALFLMNSQKINIDLVNNSAPVLEARLAETPEEKLETLYIGFLARKPTEAEVEALLPAFKQDPEKARQRIIWAMLNTQQFLFIQ